MPIFWWGLLLILLFSVQLGWTPVSGRIAVAYYIEPVTGFLLIDRCCRTTRRAFRSALSHLILPAIVLGTMPLAVIARMTRSAMLEVLGEDYIRTARAKGLAALRVVVVHALRNALIPVVTVIGLQVGALLSGAILTETIFSWPGVGHWLVEEHQRRDYPVLQGGTLLVGTIVMMVNLLVDLTYGVHQSAHPARPMSAQAVDTADRRRAAAMPPPHPLREFWRRFFARTAARSPGWSSSAAAAARARSPTSSRRIRRSSTNDAAFLTPPVWQAGGITAPTCSAPTLSAATCSRA